MCLFIWSKMRYKYKMCHAANIHSAALKYIAPSVDGCTDCLVFELMLQTGYKHLHLFNLQFDWRDYRCRCSRTST